MMHRITVGKRKDLLFTLTCNWWLVFHFIYITVHTVASVQYTESTPIFTFEKCMARSKTSLNPTIVQDNLVSVCTPIVHKLEARLGL